MPPLIGVASRPIITIRMVMMGRGATPEMVIMGRDATPEMVIRGRDATPETVIRGRDATPDWGGISTHNYNSN